MAKLGPFMLCRVPLKRISQVIWSTCNHQGPHFLILNFQTTAGLWHQFDDDNNKHSSPEMLRLLWETTDRRSVWTQLQRAFGKRSDSSEGLFEANTISVSCPANKSRLSLWARLLGTVTEMRHQGIVNSLCLCFRINALLESQVFLLLFFPLTDYLQP